MRNNSVQEKIALAILVGLIVLGAGRVLSSAWEFGAQSLQMDFAAFYTAGEARAAGLSPYVNHMDQEDPIWDGVSVLRHSRFLYPPIAARLFQPLSWLPYAWAKQFWMVLSLLCLGGGLYLFYKSLPERPSKFIMLILIAATLWFHPVLTLLERGQIDGVTFFLLCLCFVWVQRDSASQIGAGVSLAVATFLKLHCVYFLPFLVLRKKWFSLVGFGSCFIVGMLASVVLDGYDLNRAYVVDHVPRIARYGEGGTPEQMMPRFALAPHIENLQTGYAIKDGIRYKQSTFDFVAGATLVDLFTSPSQSSDKPDSSWVSIEIFFMMFVAIVGLYLLLAREGDFSVGVHDWIFWQMAMIIVLLCAPTTWVMNVVWMLPTFAILGMLYGTCNKNVRLPLYLGAIGVLFAWMPDHYSLFVLVPLQDILEYKYVLAEGITLIALGWLLVIMQTKTHLR